jgi:hypothetical protein
MIQNITFGLFCTLALLRYQRIKPVPVFPITLITGDRPEFIYWEQMYGYSTA